MASRTLGSPERAAHNTRASASRLSAQPQSAQESMSSAASQMSEVSSAAEQVQSDHRASQQRSTRSQQPPTSSSINNGAAPSSTKKSAPLNPRRRRREDGSNGTLTVEPRQPRKRSRIASEQFVPVSKATRGSDASIRSTAGAVEESVGHANGDANGHGHAEGASKTVGIPVREGRVVSGAFASRAQLDGGIILTKNDDFVVQDIGSVPEKFKKLQTGSYSLSFRLKQGSSHAIAVNADSVLVWDCSTPGSSPPSRSFTHSDAAKGSHGNGPPLACLLSSPSFSGMGGAAKELGLCLVYPKSGAIVFWESIDSAESLKLFDYQRQGGAVQGQIKLSSGEQVQGLVEMDNNMAGMVLLYTSTGRIAQLSLRGTYGSAQLDIQLLHNSGPKGSGFGLFGDLVHKFQGGSSKDKVVSLKTRTIGKGRVQIVSMAPDGTFKAWEASESGQPSFTGEAEVYEAVRNALVGSGLMEQGPKAAIRFLDSSILLQASTPSTTTSLALVQVDGQSGHSRLFVLELAQTSEQAGIGRIVPVGVYEPSTDSNPKLLVSQNERTVFILDGTMVPIISWPAIPADGGSAIVESLHQDLIRLRKDRAAEVSAWAADPLNPYKHSGDVGSILLFVKSAGLIRVSARAMASQLAKREFPTAKAKIEQAVFFGSQPDSVLDIRNISNFAFSAEEIDEAALEISHDILDTNTEYMRQPPASVEQHLVDRSKHHRILADYLRNFGFALSRETKWKLLQDGEKIAAARNMWKVYENRLSDSHENILEHAAQLVVKQSKKKKRDEDDAMDGSGGKDDVTRFFFTKHISGLEFFWRAVCADIKKLTGDTGKGALSVEQITDMFAAVFGALGAAFKFRQDNAPYYGLGAEELNGHGLLESGFEGLPSLWTSSGDVVRSVWLGIDLSKHLVRRLALNDHKMVSLSSELQDRIKSIAEGMDTATRIACRVYVEQYRWLMASNKPDEQNKGLEAKVAFETTIRKKWILNMYGIGQAEKGLAIAEEQEDIDSLVEVGHLELDEVIHRSRRDRQDKVLLEKARRRADRLKVLLDRYIEKFGKRFSNPFYAGYLVSGRQSSLLVSAVGPVEYRTEFFRADPSLGKLGWMHEVINLEGPTAMASAGKQLLQVAKDKESNAWSKRVELSLAKLALLAHSENPKPGEEALRAREEPVVVSMLENVDRELEIGSIQQKTYEEVRRTVLASVDAEAKLDNVMKAHGGSIVERKRQSLAQLLKLGFSDLIVHRSMSAEFLIDVLTLMDVVNEDVINGKQFFLALEVLKNASLPGEKEQFLRKVIWKRCFLKDDWSTVANTSKKRDVEVEEHLRTTITFETMLQCFQTELLSSNEPITLPSQVLGTGSKASDFEGRFTDSHIRTRLAKDNLLDDQELKGMMKKAHELDDVIKAVHELAVQEAEALTEEEIMRNARFMEFLQNKDEQRNLAYSRVRRVYDDQMEIEDEPEPMDED